MSEEETTVEVIDAVAQVKDSEAVSVTSADELQPKMRVTGVVKRLELYGAFVDIGVGTDALIHISQLGKRRVNRVSEVLEVGQEVEVWVDRVNKETNQISVTMVEPMPVDWSDLKAGQAYAGIVTRIERFGAFVDIGAEKEGLVHVSELSHEYVRDPSQAARVGERVNVQVLGFNKKKRRIDLSIKALLMPPESEEIIDFGDDMDDEDVELPTAMEIALRRAMGKEPTEDVRQSKREKGRRRKEKLREQQEDIISRTLTQKSD
jgi:ribosomal protein S1